MITGFLNERIIANALIERRSLGNPKSAGSVL
jgi:hypothetical protein